jgi:hypothetical protein
MENEQFMAMVTQECEAEVSKRPDQQTITARTWELLSHRTRLCGRRINLTLDQIRDLIFGRFACEARPAKSEIRIALRTLKKTGKIYIETSGQQFSIFVKGI